MFKHERINVTEENFNMVIGKVADEIQPLIERLSNIERGLLALSANNSCANNIELIEQFHNFTGQAEAFANNMMIVFDGHHRFNKDHKESAHSFDTSDPSDIAMLLQLLFGLSKKDGKSAKDHKIN